MVSVWAYLPETGGRQYWMYFSILCNINIKVQWFSTLFYPKTLPGRHIQKRPKLFREFIVFSKIISKNVMTTFRFIKNWVFFFKKLYPVCCTFTICIPCQILLPNPIAKSCCQFLLRNLVAIFLWEETWWAKIIYCVVWVISHIQ